MFSVHIESEGGVRELKVTMGRRLRARLSEGKGFDANMDVTPGNIDVDVRNFKKNRS